MTGSTHVGASQRLGFVSTLSALFAVVVASLVLVGWTLQVEPLKRVLPGLVAMNPLTALCFILAGASLWRSSNTGSSRSVPQVLGRWCAYTIAVIGVVHFGRFLFGWDFGFDQFLFRDQLGESGQPVGNRIAPNTALNFLFVGLTLRLLYSSSSKAIRCAQCVSLLTMLISFLALIGYAYEATFLYGVSSYIPMALHTALTFLVLSVGMLCQRPDQGVMAVVTSEHTGGVMARRLLPFAIVVPVILGGLRLVGEKRGYYDTEFGVSMTVVFTMLIFGGAIWWGAASSNRADAERKRAVEELDSFFNVSGDLFCTAGFDGYFKRLNPAWEQVLGFARDELRARPFIDFVHPDDRAATVAEAGKLAQGDETIHFENRYQHSDGSYRWFLWSARSMVSQQLIFAAARDITDRKKDQEQIQQLNSDLGLRAIQLEDLNKELEAFSYSVSHDLRAPIRHIASFAGLVRQRSGEKLDEKGRNYLSQVLDSAKEMGQLIDDLLSFSRMGRAAMQQTVVDLEALIEETLQALQPETQGRNIVWKRSRLPKARGDTAMLRQVFVNLLANAIKYTRSSDPAEIEIGCQDGNPNELVIFVRDNGVGFDMQYADKLFGVFQRLHRAEDFEGTGIGLANVRRIVARHGGRTWAEGAVNRGATFYLALPNH